MNESQGFLRIWITAAGGTVPVAGVPVRILDEDGELLHVLRSGESGLTPTVALPAPPASESLTPRTKPYTSYRVSVEAPGYAPVPLLPVPIFDGITALQPVTLVPVTDTAQESGISDMTSPLPTPDDMAPPYLVHPQSFSRKETFLDDMDLPDYGKGRETE